MLKLALLIFSAIICGTCVLAQQEERMIMLPNRLVVSKIKKPSHRIELDTNGLTSIVCITKSDSLIREQERELSGIITGFTDSTLILHVDEESAITYFHNGTMESFYYWKSEDSLQLHFDTIAFADIHSISYDKGTFKQVRGILQSTAYIYVIANIVVWVTAFIVPKKYGLMNTGNNIGISAEVAIGSGMAAIFFNPKKYKLANQPDKRPGKIRWKIEVI